MSLLVQMQICFTVFVVSLICQCILALPLDTYQRALRPRDIASPRLLDHAGRPDFTVNEPLLHRLVKRGDTDTPSSTDNASPVTLTHCIATTETATSEFTAAFADYSPTPEQFHGRILLSSPLGGCDFQETPLSEVDELAGFPPSDMHTYLLSLAGSQSSKCDPFSRAMYASESGAMGLFTAPIQHGTQIYRLSSSLAQGRKSDIPHISISSSAASFIFGSILTSRGLIGQETSNTTTISTPSTASTTATTTTTLQSGSEDSGSTSTSTTTASIAATTPTTTTTPAIPSQEPRPSTPQRRRRSPMDTLIIQCSINRFNSLTTDAPSSAASFTTTVVLATMTVTAALILVVYVVLTYKSRRQYTRQRVENMFDLLYGDVAITSDSGDSAETTLSNTLSQAMEVVMTHVKQYQSPPASTAPSYEASQAHSQKGRGNGHQDHGAYDTDDVDDADDADDSDDGDDDGNDEGNDAHGERRGDSGAADSETLPRQQRDGGGKSRDHETSNTASHRAAPHMDAGPSASTDVAPDVECGESDSDSDSDTDAEEDMCAVCLDGLSKSTQLMLPCRHQFHDECVSTWLATHHSCPICKYNLLYGGHLPDVSQAEEATIMFRIGQLLLSATEHDVKEFVQYQFQRRKRHASSTPSSTATATHTRYHHGIPYAPSATTPRATPVTPHVQQ
eukprot:m.237988 g.237988  ORF g.237988 m.237988 type:complete len:678 (-) comp15281_c0_seq3:739-2772(-)